jgi:transmembrane 9 superfamily protein 2/4
MKRCPSCNLFLYLHSQELLQIIYTYDVKWERSDVTWARRWDVYLHANPDDEIHVFSIINSLMIVLFLSAVVAMIMMRTLVKIMIIVGGVCI